MFRQAITRLPCSVPLKVFKGLLHDRKGDANLQGFAVIDPLDFQIPESLDKPVAELTRAGVDPHLCHAEPKNDLPVQALDIEQVDVRQDTVLAPWQGNGEGQCAS